MKVVVAGGGVIGCSVAYHLQAAGAQVVLVERGKLAGEASGAAAGLIIPPDRAASPGPFRDICFASLDLYPETMATVQKVSGVDIQETESGILVVAESQARMPVLKAFAEWQRRSGFETEWVDGGRLRRMEPALSQHLLGAAYSPGARHVNPALVTRAFGGAAKTAGTDIREETVVTGFLRRDGRVAGVSTNLGEITGVDHVVLAAGPWTGALAGRLGVRLATPPMRGQMLSYAFDGLHHAVWGDEGYLVPKPGGVLYVGATVEDVGFRKTTTARGLAFLQRVGRNLVPQLRRQRPASAWAGLRPGSADGFPLIGRLPGWENVWVAAGHFRNGILLSPITGVLLRQMMFEGRTELDVSAFDPGRFD